MGNNASSSDNAVQRMSDAVSSSMDEFKARLTCTLCRKTPLEGRFTFRACDLCNKKLCDDCMPCRYTIRAGSAVPESTPPVVSSSGAGTPVDGGVIPKTVSKGRGTAAWLCPACVSDRLGLHAVTEMPEVHPDMVHASTTPASTRAGDVDLSTPNCFRFNIAKRICAMSALVYGKESTLTAPEGSEVEILSTFGGYDRGGMFGFVAVGSSAAWGLDWAGSPDHPVIIVSFRGTCTVSNIMTDLNVATTKLPPGLLPVDFNISITGLQPPAVHHGFLEAYYSVRLDVLTSLQAALRTHPGASVLVTGHSLGGAAATLGALDIALNLSKVPLDAAPGSKAVTPRIGVYTFGQPRTGDDSFRILYHRVIPPHCHFRVANIADAVPKLPTWSAMFRYKHIGTLVICVEPNEEGTLNPDSYVIDPAHDVRKVPVKKMLDGAADHLLYLGCRFPNNPVQLHNE